MAAIPKNKQWDGVHRGNYSGNLWQTHNIDLERSPGRITLSNKMRRFDTTGIAYKWLLSNADTTLRWWALEDNNLMKSTNVNPVSSYSNDGLSNTPTDPQDMIIHEALNGEDRLVVTRLTDIAILNSAAGANTWLDDWWTNASYLNQTALTSGYHPMGRLERLLAIGDTINSAGARRGVIHTVDSSDTVVNSAITFPAGYSVRLIIVASDRFWFGLVEDRFSSSSTVRGKAIVIEWDGSSATYNNEYVLPGVSPLTGWLVNDIPYFITDIGAIMKYSGGGFVKVQEFPMREEGSRFDPRSRVDNQESGIDYYGAYADEEKVYINVGAPMRSTALGTDVTLGSRRIRSGIWIYNTETNNLYHHMGLGEHATADTDINYGCSPVSVPGGILRSEDGLLNRITLASSRVFTGGATWLTGEQNGIYQEVKSSDQSSNAGRNRGYFITPYIPVKDIEVAWEALWVKFKRFVDSGNRIIVKWRTLDPMRDEDASDESPVQVQGTWVDTTSFTAVVPTGVAVDDEVEILTGDNAGCLFNISALSVTPDGAATVTVTTSETAPTGSTTDTFLCRFDNFRTETAISSTTVGNQKVPFTISTTANSGTNRGEFIQLKIYMIGFSVEIDELEPLLKTFTSSSQG